MLGKFVLWPRVAAAIAVAGVGLVAACTATPTTTTPSGSTTASAAATTATSAVPPVTPQGLLAKRIGEQGGEDCPSGAESCATLFQVDRIEANPACAQGGTKPDAGRKTVVLHVAMTTRTQNEQQGIRAQQIFNPYSLKGVSPDGTVADATPGLCTSNNGLFPTTILPNSKYSGRVEITVPESATQVASAPPGGGESRGWVWPIS